MVSTIKQIEASERVATVRDLDATAAYVGRHRAPEASTS
jgi:hypothetical protein